MNLVTINENFLKNDFIATLDWIYKQNLRIFSLFEGYRFADLNIAMLS